MRLVTSVCLACLILSQQVSASCLEISGERLDNWVSAVVDLINTGRGCVDHPVNNHNHNYYESRLSDSQFREKLSRLERKSSGKKEFIEPISEELTVGKTSQNLSVSENEVSGPYLRANVPAGYGVLSGENRVEP